MNEIVSIPESMFDKTYRDVGWGIVRGQGGLLVGYRNSKNDPLRSGQIVFPGGGVKDGETREEAIIREVFEETDVIINNGKKLKASLTHTNFIEEEKLSALIEPDGRIWLEYRDSGKYYVGEVFEYREFFREPKDKGEITSPGFMQMSEIFKKRSNFTPACRIIVDILESVNNRRTDMEKAQMVTYDQPLDIHLNAKIKKE